MAAGNDSDLHLLKLVVAVIIILGIVTTAVSVAGVLLAEQTRSNQDSITANQRQINAAVAALQLEGYTVCVALQNIKAELRGQRATGTDVEGRERRLVIVSCRELLRTGFPGSLSAAEQRARVRRYLGAGAGATLSGK